MKRYQYINIGLSLGLSPIEVLRDLTPGELHDLVAMRSKKEDKHG